jgi:hypothetical protein
MDNGEWRMEKCQATTKLFEVRPPFAWQRSKPSANMEEFEIREG